MFSSSKKPYTAVTVQVERLTSPEHDENDFSGIVDLIDVIRIQDTGPTEAARALRKKLKYGSAHRQLRALAILDGLIQNAGGHFQRTFIDEPLLERLRMLPRETMTDAEVRDRCNTLYRQWATDYKSVPGLSGIALLHKELPRRKKPTAAQSRVIRENDAEAQENPFGSEPDSPRHGRNRSYSRPSPHNFVTASPSSSSRPRAQSSGSVLSTNSGSTATNATTTSKKDKSSSRSHKFKSFNLEREKPTMLSAIANSSITSTNLLNALKHVNREAGDRVSADPNVMHCFQSCKALRRQILRYIQLVESEQWIGSLLSANDDLVDALMTFEIMDKSIEEDSDSEAEGVGLGMGSPTMGRKMSNPGSPMTGGSATGSRGLQEHMAGLTIMEQPPAKPPRPGGSSLGKTTLKAPPPPTNQLKGESEMENAGNDDDPFGDHNAIAS
ncbi:MAG: putative actin patch assembly and actin polymerization protein [Alyxoria varia]|nr:MAG: putative actin patch assembly and actin polymerization protein [Alyxoria varia]